MKYLPAIIVIVLGLLCMWQGYSAGRIVIGMGLLAVGLQWWRESRDERRN